MEEAKPALLEPVMNVEVQAPVEYAGDLMGDMNGRRGRDLRHGHQGRHADHPRPGADVGNAELPERPDFHDAGPRLVQHGVLHYDFVPPQLAEKIVAEAKAAREGIAEEEE